MITLPQNFEDKMKELLQDEYDAYIASYEKESWHGFRVNHSKIKDEDLIGKLSFDVHKVPWIYNGYFYDMENSLTHHPYYYAGLYYVQEPSAMTPASRLPVEPGDKVLDLCAAPGGKATELGARLQGKGILFTNDISNSRAKILLKNLERMGIGNIFVTSEESSNLEKHFTGYFDKILLDAPCSGEGMFRREPSMISYWKENGPDYYSPIQRELLEAAYRMLKPGGMLLYSTCTFALEENEENIAYILDTYKDMHLIEIESYEGFSHGYHVNGQDLSKCVRIFPHKMDGEGHFLALMKKEESDEGNVSKSSVYKGKTFSQLPDCCQEFFNPMRQMFDEGSFYIQKELIYYLPKDAVLPGKLRYLRTGLFLGECKKNRFEPSQALAMYLKKEQYPNTCNLASEDIRTVKYLKGETISLEEKEYTGKDGWNLVCTDGYPLGWGKRNKNMLKNKYAPGWRWQ